MTSLIKMRKGFTLIELLVVIAMIAIGYVKRLIAKNDDLMERQTAEFRHQLREIGARLDAHIREDRGQEMLNELRHLNSSMANLSTQMTRVLETTAEQGRDIENNKAYIERLREDLQSHVKDCTRRK